MHELSLVMSLLDQVQEASINNNFRQVKRIRLAVGVASGVNTDALEFCFHNSAAGTILEGAKIDIERVLLEAHCQSCQMKIEADDLYTLFCASCKTANIRVTRGKEFLILDLDVI